MRLRPLAVSLLVVGLLSLASAMYTLGQTDRRPGRPFEVQPSEVTPYEIDRLRLLQELEVLEYKHRVEFKNLTDEELRSAVLKLAVKIRLLEQRIEHLENPRPRVLRDRVYME